MHFDSSVETIHPRDFQLFQQLIHKETGIWLRDTKQLMLCSRISRRLHHHGITSFRKYYEFLVTQDSERTELLQLINCVTTNKTSFFREPHHFHYLEQVVRERIQLSRSNSGMGKFRVWSAACSTGEEPYSILMTLLETISSSTGATNSNIAGLSNRTSIPQLPRWDLQILATDIDTDVLKKAAAGIYQTQDAADLPSSLLHKYCLRGTGKMDGMLRINPGLRNRINFKRLNFKDSFWDVGEKFDAIFCRNCLIYFNAQMQEQVILRLIENLNPGGHLFLGHSEHLPWLQDHVEQVERTTYRRPIKAISTNRIDFQRAIATVSAAKVGYDTEMQASYR